MDERTDDAAPLLDSPLKGYDLQCVQFSSAYWKGINASGLELYQADLSKSGLVKARFDNAVLNEANLCESFLRNASLLNADLRKANLSGANLQGANFSGAKVCEAKFLGVKWGDTPPAGVVDLSPLGDGSQPIPIMEWLPSKTSQ